MKVSDIVKEMLEKKEGFEQGKLDESLKLQQDLSIDSLDIINLLVEIEEKFDVELFDALDMSIYDMTVMQFCEYVEMIIRKKEK